MDILSNNIYNFIYIAVIILGGVTTTLTLILHAKERDKQHKAIFLFVGSIFVYMLVDFITYYFLGEMASGGVVFALITLSDTLFCLLMVAWVYVVIVFIRIEEEVRMRWITAITVIYLLCSQLLSISLGRYDSYALQVESGMGKLVLQILNAGYAVFMILIGLRCIVLLFRKYKKASAGRTMNLIMALLLIGYMVWIAYWDYSTWYKTEENLLDIYAMDPLILLYAILSIILIYYFYKKDPLHLSESQVAPEVAVKLIAERHQLSEREREVLEELNKGKSNKQIAADLCISENTVKRHVNNIFKKTETRSRHELIFKVSNVKI